MFAIVGVASMNITFKYCPTGGWHTFSESAALTEALWERLDLSGWHYMNFTSDSSIWESKKDGSVLIVTYLQSKIVELLAETGQSEQTFDPIAVEFGLEKSDHKLPPKQ